MDVPLYLLNLCLDVCIIHFISAMKNDTLVRLLNGGNKTPNTTFELPAQMKTARTGRASPNWLCIALNHIHIEYL